MNVHTPLLQSSKQPLETLHSGSEARYVPCGGMKGSIVVVVVVLVVVVVGLGVVVG